MTPVDPDELAAIRRLTASISANQTEHQIYLARITCARAVERVEVAKGGAEETSQSAVAAATGG